MCVCVKYITLDQMYIRKYMNASRLTDVDQRTTMTGAAHDSILCPTKVLALLLLLCITTLQLHGTLTGSKKKSDRA